MSDEMVSADEARGRRWIVASETWRVVLASGEVREVEVITDIVEGCPPEYSCGGECSTHSAHDAVVLWLGESLWPSGHMLVREILAPGEPTRAELIAERDEARAELARLRTCEGYFADRDRDAAWTAGAEAMREAILDALPCVTAERDECAARMHRVAIPVPPCPEVSDEQ